MRPVMSALHRDFDMPNPFFIPARSRVCDAAQSLMIFGFAFLGLVAALICVVNQVSGGLQ
ncbi:hypothetical protein [Shinella sp.]|jgi:hypothetical protein|uniref:hypothetical protein n=1 Tax=Shinella sp. TaxID=1870904 RepID=UPI003F6F50FF